MSRGNRRADGLLRPSVVRRRARKRGTTYIATAMVERFRALTIPPCVIWNSLDLREQLGLDTVALGARLEELANGQRWAKLRDTDDVVRAIGLPRNHPERAALRPRQHREVMLARIVGAVAEAQAA